MKSLISILLLFGALNAFAQQPSPDPDTLQNPIKQTDPVLNHLPPDQHYIADQVRITADELPAAVLDSLKAVEPTGWEKSVVYRDKNSEQYMIEVRESGHEKTYRFDKTGRQMRNPDDEEGDDSQEQLEQKQ